MHTSNLPKVAIDEDVCLHGESKTAVDEVTEGEVEEQHSCGFADQGESLTVVLHGVGHGEQGKKIAACPQDNDVAKDGNLVILDGLGHTVVPGEKLVEVIIIMEEVGVGGGGAGDCSQTGAGAVGQMLMFFRLNILILIHIEGGEKGDCGGWDGVGI